MGTVIILYVLLVSSQSLTAHRRFLDQAEAAEAGQVTRVTRVTAIAHRACQTGMLPPTSVALHDTNSGRLVAWAALRCTNWSRIAMCL